MEIKEIGREGLIKRILDSFGELAPDKGYFRETGVYSGSDNVLISSLMMMEGVDFDLVYFPLRYLGFKIVTAVSSCVFSDGGTPKALALSLALSGRFQVEDVEVFMEGVREGCKYYGIQLIHLDLTSSLTGFAISATALGTSTSDYVGTPEEGELICVTGDLGAAFMGLQLMIREKQAFDDTIDFLPDFGGREYLLERQLKPILPSDLLKEFAKRGLQPTSLRVLRRGLTDTLHSIAKIANVGMRLYEKSLPIDYQTARMAEDLNLDPTYVALHGGDDYQFVFTLPLTQKELLDSFKGVTSIGFTTSSDNGLVLVGKSGGETAITPDDFTKDSNTTV